MTGNEKERLREVYEIFHPLTDIDEDGKKYELWHEEFNAWCHSDEAEILRAKIERLRDQDFSGSLLENDYFSYECLPEEMELRKQVVKNALSAERAMSEHYRLVLDYLRQFGDSSFWLSHFTENLFGEIRDIKRASDKACGHYYRYYTDNR